MPKRTILPDARVSPRFAGVTTFCRYPRIQDVLKENAPVDWAIYGVPFDSGVTYRPGSRFGPRAIRTESQYVKRFSIEHDVDVCNALSVCDAGDSPVNPYDCEQNAIGQLAFARTLGDPKVTRLMAIGGDHTIAYANIAATWERQGSPKGGLALIHFDSHLDTVESVWGERWGHASVFRRAIEDGYVDASAMLSIGVKGPLNSKADLEFARDRGVTLLTYEQWRMETIGSGTGSRAGVSPTLSAFVQRLGARPTYLTFDIDCVDPAFAPGTGTPSVGGFTSAEALGLLRACKGVRVVGADVVEVLPDRDVSGITALLAAHVMFEVLALDAARR